MARLKFVMDSRYSHPSPLPEGEGAIGSSFFNPLSLWERVRVRAIRATIPAGLCILREPQMPVPQAISLATKARLLPPLFSGVAMTTYDKITSSVGNSFDTRSNLIAGGESHDYSKEDLARRLVPGFRA